MPYRNANYCAFYVDEPFDACNLGYNVAHDFCFYRQLQAWKERNPSFPFVDAHQKTYSVRDGSDWEGTLKPRLHERLRNSKNIILFLSNITKNSRALHEEIEYGIGSCGLPVIVIYPDFKEKIEIAYDGYLTGQVKKLWDRLLIFRELMQEVAVFHVPYQKVLIEHALMDKDFMVDTMGKPDNYWYK